MELRPSDVGAAFSDQLVTASGTYELHAGSGASFGPSRKLPCGQAPTVCSAGPESGWIPPTSFYAQLVACCEADVILE